VVSHSVLKDVLLDRQWAAEHRCSCFGGDTKPFWFSSGVNYRPDAVWETRGGKLWIIEVADTEDQRAVVGEFFLACMIKNAVHFTAMVNEGREWIKPYLFQAWRLLRELTSDRENGWNSLKYRPSLVVIPRQLGNDKNRIKKYLNRVWK